MIHVIVTQLDLFLCFSSIVATHVTTSFLVATLSVFIFLFPLGLVFEILIDVIGLISNEKTLNFYNKVRSSYYLSNSSIGHSISFNSFKCEFNFRKCNFKSHKCDFNSLTSVISSVTLILRSLISIPTSVI
jgi:hypothetical protein